MKTHARAYTLIITAFRFGLIVLTIMMLSAALCGRCLAQMPTPTKQADGGAVNIAVLCNGGLRALTQGREFPSQVKPGETQCWRVRLPAHHFMHVHVEQKGIDVVVQLYKGPGVPVGEEIDSPNDNNGEEPVYEVSGADTDYVLAVSSRDEHPAKPDYTIKIEEWREARDTDADFVAGERAFLKGQLLYASATNIELATRQGGTDKKSAYAEAVGSYRGALDALYRASSLLPSQEEKGRELRGQALNGIVESHVRLGLMSCVNDDPDEGLKQFAALRDLSHKSGSAIGEIKTLILSKDCAATTGRADQEKTFAEEFNRLDVKSRARASEVVGDLYWAHQYFLKAVDAYSAAARAYRDMSAHNEEASVITRMGQGYFDLSMLPQARAQYEEALRIEDAGDAVRSNTKYNFGVVLEAMGDTKAALRELTEADKLTPETDVEQRAYILHSLGRLYAGQGKYEPALDLVRRALKLTEGKEALKNATAYEYLYLGFINLLQGRRVPGLENTNIALRLWGELNDPRGQGNALYNLGHMAFDRGDMGTALSYLKQAQQLQQGDPYGLAYTLTSMGSIDVSRGNFEAAQEEFKQALELRDRTGDRQGALQTLTLWANAEKARGHLKEADDKLGQAAQRLEELRAEVPGADMRASYFSTVVQVYNLRIDVLMQLYEREHQQSYLEEALALGDSIHARSLLDVLAGGDPASPPASLLGEESKLIERLNHAVARRQLLLFSPHTPQQLDDARQQVVSLRTDWQRLRDRIDNDERFSLLRPKLLSASEIKGLLDPDTLLLEFVLGKERSYLWLVSADGIERFNLRPQEQVERAVKRLLGAINGSASASQGGRGQRAPARRGGAWRSAPATKGTARGMARRATRSSEFTDASTDLSTMLFGDVAGRLGEKRLIIVADGILNYVPFSALTDTARGGNKWKPLLTDHEIVVSPSAAVSAVLQERARTRPPAPQLLALIGDPLYEVGESDAPAAVRSSVRARAAALLQTDQISLPFLKDEIEGIDELQKTFAPAEGERLVHREEVSIDSATAGDLKDYRIIHYATHGVFDDTDPESSGLLLSLYNEQRRPRESGYFLSLPKVYRMNLAADLVVLSACQSALGPEVKGEGIMGLTRAFMQAGAARVVSSLWVVNDARTSRLMNEFYQQMLKAEVTRPAAALREAQLSLYRAREGPEVWAAFELQGDWKEFIRIRPERR
ncbi:MAG: CHAT domain-containing protein [Pyrinomonadaceae bacterium]